ncbi:MAG: glycosyltransferase [Hyphomicrobiales bacterium]|nr:glycosyltransferase [Hyphomicrobiales bacterium]
MTFAVDFEAHELASLLTEDVALKVLPRGHAAATLALAKLIASLQPAASLSAISVSNLKHAVAAGLARRNDRAILSYHGFFDSEPERLSRIGYRLTPALTRAAGATVAVSHALRKDLVQRFRAPDARTAMIFNPGAPEPFPTPVDAATLAARPPLVVALGRLAPDKDFVTLLRAFARLKTPGARLVILGEGAERALLESEIAALGLAGRVDVPGFHANPGEILAGARAFALTSRREAFSLVCVEALAHGLPIVATDCGGPREILDAPALGRIAPVGDVDAIARALDASLADPGDPAPRQKRALDFTLETALDGYDRLIRSVVTHARSPG